MDKQEATGILSGVLDALTQNFRRQREAEDPEKARARMQAMHERRVDFYRTLITEQNAKENNNG